MDSNNNMPLGLTEHLPSLVARRFSAAKQSNALVFSETQVTTIRSANTPFQLRYCPALAKKPSAPSPAPNTVTGKFDPFQDPSPDLTIAEIPSSNPSHVLVLNKFPVISNHFILATKEFKPQTHLLEAPDLWVTFLCLREWEKSKQTQPAAGDGSIQDQKRLFAFFNSGEHSGASQPHRHLQFLPVEDMQQIDGDGHGDGHGGWAPLIDGGIEEDAAPSYDFPNQLNLPFTCYAASIPQNPTPNDLHRLYLSLYAMAVTAAAQHSASLIGNIGSSGTIPTEGESAISYNLAMTTSRMMICPRKSEHAWINLNSTTASGGDSKIVDEGLVKLNGTILAGTLMVKAEAEWNELQREPEVLEAVLKTVGIPTSPV